jgi:hypothetical protein
MLAFQRNHVMSEQFLATPRSPAAASAVGQMEQLVLLHDPIRPCKTTTCDDMSG